MGGDAERNREDVRRHRQRLRERGLRPVQIWLPDVRAPGFAAEARRQSELVARSPQAEQDTAFVETLSDGAWGPWDE